LELEKLYIFTHTANYSKGETVYKSNQRVDGVYIIRKGRFSISKYYMSEIDYLLGKQSTTLLELLEVDENDVFGEVEVLQKAASREFEVHCLEDGEVLFYPFVPFMFVSTPYSLKKKHDPIQRKLQRLNFLYKIKSTNLSTRKNPLKIEKIKIIERDVVVRQPKKRPSNKRFEVNYHGFGNEGRKFGGGDQFEKALDKYITPKVQKLKFLDRVKELEKSAPRKINDGPNTTGMNFQKAIGPIKSPIPAFNFNYRKSMDLSLSLTNSK